MALRLQMYFIVMSFLIVICEPRPNDTGKKHKRMVPVLIERVRAADRDIQSSYEEYGSGVYPGLKSIEYRTKAMEELLDVLGLKVPDDASHTAVREKTKKPPKYMVDLYNAIADVNGITITPGLLNADTVRSIPNIGSPESKFCKFDLSAVTDDEVVLDAELHFFQSHQNLRKNIGMRSLYRTQQQQSSQSTTYIIKIYQMLSETDSPTPIKKLISARRVHSYHSGWHIFPILSTVRNWMEVKNPNYGIMTEITAMNGQAVDNTPERESLQPILVIFANNTKPPINETDPKASPNGISDSTSQHARQVEALKRLQHLASQRNSEEDLIFDDSVVRKKRSSGGQSPKNGEKKRQNQDRKSRKNRNRNRGNTARKDEDEEHDTDGVDNSEVMTVEQYYEYGNKEDIFSNANDEYSYSDMGNDYFSDDSEKPKTNKGKEQTSSNSRFQQKPFTSFTSMGNSGKSNRNCRRYPLHVDFEELGWSGWIIHPQGYNAYHCKGECSFPLGQNLNPSNHATVQSIMHALRLGTQPVAMPCCAPDKLYDINLLYFDENDYVVLRRYKDMVASSCACR